MPEDHPYRKNPSVADLVRKRAVEKAVEAAERANQQAALAVVERWNAEQSVLWSPTIRCAVAAGTPWLDVYCPGCRTSRAIDIRTLDRHPLASVGSLALGLRCSWCPGPSTPMPVLTGLHAAPPAARWSKRMPVEFLHARPLGPEELEMIRQQIEALDDIDVIDDEIRGIVKRNWAHLLPKLPPEED
jgi:hypothetical protein